MECEVVGSNPPPPNPVPNPNTNPNPNHNPNLVPLGLEVVLGVPHQGEPDGHHAEGVAMVPDYAARLGWVTARVMGYI